MAADAIGLLDALGIASAHVAGASMGAMIGQTMAIEYPDRVRSLTSMMSTTGDPAAGQPDLKALAALAGPPPQTRQEVMDAAARAFRVIGSPGYELDEAAVAERAGLANDRCYDPAGAMRHLVAAVASGDRTARLRSVRVPALVIHGTSDPVFDVSGGRATAAAIPGAELVVLDGMGHSFPPGRWDELTSRIAELAHRTERVGAGHTGP
jgi:pimeloyl-ACP methyl ester carboxylesterase